MFNQMRKSQNNPDQSGFHLSAAHVDVQPILLMAVLEENKTTAFVTETIPHIHAQPQVLSKRMCFYEDLQIIFIHSSIFSPLQVQAQNVITSFHQHVPSAASRDPQVPPGQCEHLHWVTGLHLGLLSVINLRKETWREHPFHMPESTQIA